MSERRGSLTLAQAEVDSLKTIFEKELSELVEDDGEMSDLLNFTVVMIQNGKTVPEMEKELDDIYGEEYAKRIGALLVAYFGEKKSSGEMNGEKKAGEGNVSGKTPRLKTLKSSREGNALTMSGALGASREGGRASREDNRRKTDDMRNFTNGKAGNRNNNNRDDRGGRGDRRKNAFDRLTTHESRERRDTRKNERGGGRSGRGGGRDGGRDNHRGGRGGRDEEGGRISGFRRDREGDTEVEDFIPARRGGGRGGRSYFDGRGAGRNRFDQGGCRGRGRSGDYGRGNYGRGNYGRGNYGRGQSGESPNKRQRVSEGEEKCDDGEDRGGTGVTTVGGTRAAATTEGAVGGAVATTVEVGRDATAATASDNQNNNSVNVDQNLAGVNNGQGNFDQEYNGHHYFEGDGYGHGGYGNYRGYHGGNYRGRGGRYGRGRGRGRGRFSTSGRGGRLGEVQNAGQENNEGGCNEAGEGVTGTEEECNDGMKSGENDPTLGTGNTTLSYSGRGYGHGGRGRGFYQGGRGRGGYRTQVTHMIASKSWVRKNDDTGEVPSGLGLDIGVESGAAPEAVPAAAPTATAD